MGFVEFWLFKSESKPKIFLTCLRCWSDFLKITDSTLEISEPIKSIKAWGEGTNFSQGSILAKMLVEIIFYFFRVFCNANEYLHFPPSFKIWVMRFIVVRAKWMPIHCRWLFGSYVADNWIKKSVMEKSYIRDQKNKRVLQEGWRGTMPQMRRRSQKSGGRKD